MASAEQIDEWTDRVVEGLRTSKKGPLTLAYPLIRAKGITHWPDVQRLGKQVLARLQERRKAASQKSHPEPTEEAIARANLYQ